MSNSDRGELRNEYLWQIARSCSVLCFSDFKQSDVKIPATTLKVLIRDVSVDFWIMLYNLHAINYMFVGSATWLKIYALVLFLSIFAFVAEITSKNCYQVAQARLELSK